MDLILRNLSLKYKGNKIWVDVYAATRGGTLSPVTFYFKHKDKWIVPLESRLGFYDPEIIKYSFLRYVAKVNYLSFYNTNNVFIKAIKLDKSSGGHYLIPDTLNK